MCSQENAGQPDSSAKEAQADKAPGVALRIQGVMLSLKRHSVADIARLLHVHRRRVKVFLPPSCPPKFNAVERVWPCTRVESARNGRFDTADELCRSLFSVFAGIQRHPE